MGKGTARLDSETVTTIYTHDGDNVSVISSKDGHGAPVISLHIAPVNGVTTVAWLDSDDAQHLIDALTERMGHVQP